MARAYYDEDKHKVVIPTREEVLEEAYNVGWNISFNPNYVPETQIDLTDKRVYMNWKIGLKEGEKAKYRTPPTR